MSTIIQAIAAGDQAALTKALRADLTRNRAHIPDTLKSRKAWLVWEVSTLDPAKGKFGKVPRYPVSGQRRHGRQGSASDLEGLGTWEEAIAAFHASPSVAGVGLAMLPQNGLVALDADGCITRNGDDFTVAETAETLIRDTYAETSPSGFGVRAFWLGAAADGKNHADGLELFHAKGFVTVTGNRLHGSEPSALLPDHALRLEALATPAGRKEPSAIPANRSPHSGSMPAFPPSARELGEAREALSHIPADDRELWIRMGHALKAMGDEALPFWHEWSAKSEKYDAADAERVWQSFEPTQTGPGAIFAEAKRNGWEAPARSVSATGKTAMPHIINARDLAAKSFAPLQWAIPTLLPEGLAILAGKPKAGKSFFAMQMALAVASGDGESVGIGAIPVGDVTYLALEDSERRLKERQERMRSWTIPERLHFATAWPRIGAGGIEALEGLCDAHPQMRLIIIDTWRTMKPPGTARRAAYDEDALSAAPLLDFVRARPGLACLVIHHTRKAEADDPFDTLSGTHGLTGVFDTLMVLGRHGVGAKLVAQGRDLELYEKAMERDQRTGGWTMLGDAVEHAKTGERQELLDLITKAGGATALSDLASAVGKRSDTTCRLLKGLIDEGHIYQPGHGLYALTKNAQITQPAFNPELF